MTQVLLSGCPVPNKARSRDSRPERHTLVGLSNEFKEAGTKGMCRHQSAVGVPVAHPLPGPGTHPQANPVGRNLDSNPGMTL